MKRNRMYIQDGTGESSDYDFVITSYENVKVGEVIAAKGNLNLNNDFDSGQVFKVIVEIARISKEI